MLLKNSMGKPFAPVYYKRKNILQRITKDYGLVVEYDDCFICHITQQSIDKIGMNTFITICLNGIPISQENETLGLNKPIRYIFNGIILPPIRVTANNCSVTFKNCTFDGRLILLGNGHFLLENNRFGLLDFDADVDSLSFFNDPNYYIHSKRLNVHAKKMAFRDFRNLNFRGEFEAKLSATDIKFEHSNFGADAVNINSEHISSTGSVIKANEIVIQNSGYDLDPESLKLDSLFIHYNSKLNLLDPKEDIPDIQKRHEKRKTLVQLLHNMQVAKAAKIVQETQKYKKELEQQPISKL